MDQEKGKEMAGKIGDFMQELLSGPLRVGRLTMGTKVSTNAFTDSFAWVVHVVLVFLVALALSQSFLLAALITAIEFFSLFMIGRTSNPWWGLLLLAIIPVAVFVPRVF